MPILGRGGCVKRLPKWFGDLYKSPMSSEKVPYSACFTEWWGGRVLGWGGGVKSYLGNVQIDRVLPKGVEDPIIARLVVQCGQLLFPLKSFHGSVHPKDEI